MSKKSLYTKIFIWPYSVLVLLFNMSVVNCFSAGGVLPGDGTETSPFVIEDIEDFDAFCSDSNKWLSGVHVRLDSDIDLSGKIYNRAPISPDPITNPDSVRFDGIAFAGELDGNGHSIKNLTIILSGYFDGGIGWVYSHDDYLGLIGQIKGGSVKNLALVHDNIQYFG